MLLRVYVDTPDQFQQWIANQQQTQPELTKAAVMMVSEPNAGISMRATGFAQIRRYGGDVMAAENSREVTRRRAAGV